MADYDNRLVRGAASGVASVDAGLRAYMLRVYNYMLVGLGLTGGVAWLTANTDNVASVRVAEKAGFRREGTLRRAGLEEDGLHDQAVFSLLDDEL